MQLLRLPLSRMLLEHNLRNRDDLTGNDALGCIIASGLALGSTWRFQAFSILNSRFGILSGESLYARLPLLLCIQHA